MATLPLPHYVHISPQSLDSLKADILSSTESYVAVDTETTGLRWMEDRAFGVSLAWDDKAAFIRNTDFGVSNIGIFLTDLFKADYKTFVFHNCEFDLHMIRETYGALPPKNVLDTLRLAHLRDTGGAKGLKELGVEIFGTAAAAAEDTIKVYREKYNLKDYSFVPADFMDPYACMDTVLTKALAYLFLDELKERPGHMQLVDMEHRLIPVIMSMEQRGIKLDEEYCSTLHRQLRAQQRDIQDEVYSIVGRPLELSSPKQLGEYFYDQLKIKPSIKTDGGGRATNVKALQKITHPVGSKVAKLILDWRDLEKLDNTYVQSYPKLQHKGRIHAHWNASGTITGRFSGSNPNLQNIPRKKEIRRLFVPDQEFFDFDYAQQELRVAAHVSKQQNMMDAFNSGIDMHMYTANLIWGDGATKTQRQTAKQTNFASLYGAGARKLADEAGISYQQATAIFDQFWTSYPELRYYSETQLPNEVMTKGYVRTLYGRRIHIAGKDSYKAVNYVIQGTCAEMSKISLFNVWEHLNQVGGYICNVVHDSIVLDEVDESELPRIQEIMEDFTNSPNGRFKVPMLVEMKRSKKSWGDMSDE